MFQLWDVDENLNNTLLKIDDSGCISVNLDNMIKLLIRESDCLVKMGLELPIVCQSLYAKKNYFTLVNDSLQVGNSTKSKTINDFEDIDNKENFSENDDDMQDDEDEIIISQKKELFFKDSESLELTLEFYDDEGDVIKSFTNLDTIEDTYEITKIISFI